MKGARPFTLEEIEKIKEYYENYIGSDKDQTFDIGTRNWALIMFGMYSGFRIAEILSIDVKDVVQNERIVDEVYLERKNTKNKVEGRTGVVNIQCKKILEKHINHYGLVDKMKEDPNTPLFISNKGGRLMTRQAINIIYDLSKTLGFNGKLSTHTLRKTFSKYAYELLDRNILDLQKALGHRS